VEGDEHKLAQVGFKAYSSTKKQ